MILSYLKPKESIKTNSKTFALISERIAHTILLKNEEKNGHSENENTVKTELTKTEFQPHIKQKIVYEMKEYKHQEDILPENTENEPLSKMSIIEKYDPKELKKIKNGIKHYIQANERAIKQSEEYNRNQMKLWNETVKARSSILVNIPLETHPKGREDLDQKKIANIRKKLVNEIPPIRKNKVFYVRSELKKDDLYDKYSNEIWSLKDIQKFINLFFEYHKDFEGMREKMPHKEVYELIALYDIMNPVLLLKKIYKKVKRKSPANRREILRPILQQVKEKLLYILKDVILRANASESIVTLGEVTISRRELIECFLLNKAS